MDRMKLRFVTQDLGDSLLKWLHSQATFRQQELSCSPIPPWLHSLVVDPIV